MTKNQLNVAVLSGLSFSGKSHYMNLLMSSDIFRGFAFLSADHFRDKYVGENRQYTLPELRVFREAVWLEIKRNLVIRRSSVALEMVLKTRLDHWQPLKAAIESAQGHLTDVYQEHLSKGNELDHFQVSLRVITLFNNPTLLDRRIKLRTDQLKQEGNITGTNIFDAQSFARKSGVEVFELPAVRESLFVDTSDESDRAVSENISKITEYVLNGTLPDQQELFIRAGLYLEDLKTLAGC